MKAVILAAGRSSRFWPIEAERHKCLTSICGRSLLQRTLDQLESSSIDHVIIVEDQYNTVSEAINPNEREALSVDFVVQKTPQGMGHALLQAEPYIDDRFIVMTPYRSNSKLFLQKLIDKQEKTNCEAVLLTTKTDTPSKYGIIETSNGKPTTIKEKPTPQETSSNNRVVGMYLLQPSFFRYLSRTEQHEYQYEEALSSMISSEDVRMVETERKTASIKYPWDLFDVAETVLSGTSQTIADTAVIDTTATVTGPVIIEDNVTVYENAVIRGPAYIGEQTTIGNNALVRKKAVIEANCTIGAYSEVRNSILQENVSVHDTFLGDSIVGKNSSFGAGTIIANRQHKNQNGKRPTISVTLEKKGTSIDTGRTRLGCVVGNNVQIGTQCNIMPGTLIGPRSIIGPSTPVFKNVGEEKRYYAQFNGVEKNL